MIKIRNEKLVYMTWFPGGVDFIQFSMSIANRYIRITEYKNKN